MSQTEELLPLLKQHVNAAEFDQDDDLLRMYLNQSMQQVLSMCNRGYSEIVAMSEEMDFPAVEGGFPADFAGAILELAAAKYRYGEAYSDTTFRFTPSFRMVVSKYRKHYIPGEKQNTKPGRR